MKRNLKTGTIAFFVAVIVAVFAFTFALIFSLVTVRASATGAPTITVGSATANAGGTVDIPVSVSGNPGIGGFAFTVDYDESAMTLVSASQSSAIGGQLYLSKRLIWIGAEDYEGNGILFTLKFTVSDAASGTYAVSLKYEKGDVCNYNEEEVDFLIVPGSIKVGLPGDVSGDGLITIKDLSDLKHLLAGLSGNEYILANCDVNEDGKITIKDIATLKIMLAG